MSDPNVIVARLISQTDNLSRLRCLAEKTGGHVDDIDHLINTCVGICYSSESNEVKMSMIQTHDLYNKIISLAQTYASGPTGVLIFKDIVANSLDVESDNTCSCGGRGCARCEEQFEKKPTRSREENISQHSYTWLERIEGSENVVIPDAKIEELREKIKSEYTLPNGALRDVSGMALDVFKSHMNDIRMAEYKHIVFIYRKVMNSFGYSVPTTKFTNDEKDSIVNFIIRCYEIFKSIKDKPDFLDRIDVEDIQNMPSYCFMIYKIIPLVVNDTRRANILRANIVFQEDETIVKNEILWDILYEQYKVRHTALKDQRAI